MLKKKKSEIPSCSSFGVVRDAVLSDPLTLAKLNFFVFVTELMKPYLTKYQADQPLAVFMATDLILLLTNVMELFVKPDVLNDNTAGHKLATLDVAAHRLPASKIKIGMNARLSLDASGASDLQKLDFKNGCLKMLVSIATKLQERCPLKYSFLRALQAFIPSVMASQPQSARTSFQVVLKKLATAKLRTAEDCDAADQQYGRLVRE